MATEKNALTVTEPLKPENQWIAQAFIDTENDIPKVYLEIKDILQDGKVSTLEALEFGLTLPSPISHVAKAVKAIRALKFLPKSQKNAVLLAVAGDGGDIEVGMNKAQAIISYVEGLALSIDKEIKRFNKLAAALKTPQVA